MSALHRHPIVGTGYYPLNDEALAIELAGATIAHQNDHTFPFGKLIIGYRDKAFFADKQKPDAFLCIKSHTGGLHLFIVKEEQ